MPGFAGVNQFTRVPGTFEKQADGIRSEEALGERQQAGQRCERAGGDHRCLPAVQALDPFVVDGDRSTRRARHFAEKLGFAPVRLDQRHLRHTHQRQDHARKTGAAAEVDQGARAWGHMSQQLR